MVTKRKGLNVRTHWNSNTYKICINFIPHNLHSFVMNEYVLREKKDLGLILINTQPLIKIITIFCVQTSLLPGKRVQ